MAWADIFKTILGGNPLDGVTKIIEEFHAKPLTDAEREDFNIKMAALAQQQSAIEAARDQAVAEVAGQNIRAETTSQDKYTSRARPTFMYIVEAVLGFNFILLPVMQFSAGKVPAPIVLPSDLLWLFGASILGYVGARSMDKTMELPGESKIDLPFMKVSNSSPADCKK